MFRNATTGEIKEKYLRMSELDEFKVQNPNLVQMPVLINAVGQIGDIKMDSGFRDVMNSISKNNPGSNMRNY
jgi:hypothetical protein